MLRGTGAGGTGGRGRDGQTGDLGRRGRLMNKDRGKLDHEIKVGII